jgi:hypothetical protein
MSVIVLPGRPFAAVQVLLTYSERKVSLENEELLAFWAKQETAAARRIEEINAFFIILLFSY